MDIARQVEAGDAYIELERDRDVAKGQWEKLKADNPCKLLNHLASGTFCPRLPRSIARSI